MSIYVTSDLHVFHKKILDYCPDSRPFSSIDEMNEAIVENWNKKVTNEDDCYILGDVSFGKPKETCDFLDRLNGKRLHKDSLLRFNKSDIEFVEKVEKKV